MMVAGDPYRPAAVKQLQQLGEKLDVPVEADTSITPPELAKRALEKADKGGFTIVIVDTAGRSQMDTKLMGELKSIPGNLNPVDTLLGVDSMYGQEALNIAPGFRNGAVL